MFGPGLRLSDDENDRRYKIAYLSPWALLSCLIENARLPGDYINKLSLSVEPGTLVVERFYEPSRQAEAIVLYNKNWPTVQLGEMIPELPVLKTTVVILKTNTVNLEPTPQPFTLYADTQPQPQPNAQKELLAEIKAATGKEVKGVEYDSKDQVTRFYSEEGDLLEVLKDCDPRMDPNRKR